MSNRKRHFTVYRIAVLAIFIALAYVGRMMFQFIPNVQPVTVIILIITLNMGAIDGLIVAIASVILSNILLGMGPWTLTQIATYAILIGFTGLITKHLYVRKNKYNRISFAIYALLLGLLYGFVISIFSVYLFGINHFWAYYLRGLPFDLAHGMGNFVFYLLLEPILAHLIERNFTHKNRP